MTPFRLYVGTYTLARTLPSEPEQGIFYCQFDPQTGQLRLEGSADAGPNPTYLTLSRDGQNLYAVNEIAVFEGQASGSVSAFSVDQRSGALTALNTQPSHGASPCFVSLDKTGKLVMVANYRGGSISIYPVLSNGQLELASDFIQHEGHGPNPERQEKAHAHSIQTDPTNRVVLAADLGLDQVKLYQLDQAAGKLRPTAAAEIVLHPGAGPRHLDFHPKGQWLYVLNELDASLSVFKVEVNSSVFRHLSTVPTLPDDYQGRKWAADIHVHANGRFVFVSNRAHDSLTSFAIDQETGLLKRVMTVASSGRTPRNFAIDPSGRWLLVANQDGNNLIVFALDPETGHLTATGIEVNVPSPVCLKFAP